MLGTSVLNFFLMIFFKVSIGFVTVLLLLFMFWLLGDEACGILAPGSGVEPTLPASKGRFLTTGPPRKSLEHDFDLSNSW